MKLRSRCLYHDLYTFFIKARNPPNLVYSRARIPRRHAP